MINAGDRARYGTMAFLALLVTIFFMAGTVRWWGRVIFPAKYGDLIQEQSEDHRLDPLLVLALIREESAFDAKAVSRRGALGLMQVMPETGAWIAAQLGEKFSAERLLAPFDNVRYGTWYLRYLFTEFDGDTIKVLAAYNAGSNRVHVWLSRGVWDGSLAQLERMPFTETRRYVIKILRSYRIYRFLYAGGKAKLDRKRS